MKLSAKAISPKNLFRSKKPKPLSSKSEPTSTSPSFNTASASASASACSSPSTSSDPGGDRKPPLLSSTTPTSVLTSPAPFLSEEWSSSDASGPQQIGDLQEQLAEAFKLIDRDGDGKVTRGEMSALLGRIMSRRSGNKASASEVEDEDAENVQIIVTMLDEMDRDGDGCISLEEFGAISLAAFGPESSSSSTEDELREAFEVFDADGDGRITAEELQRVFVVAIGDEGCSLEDCRRMIRGVDKRGEGFVCFDDFSRMMDHQQRRRN